MNRFDPEPSFLARRRDQARAAALSMPLPDRSGHRFRFTDAAALLPAGGIEAALQAAGAAWPVRVELPDEARRAGVTALSFGEALPAAGGLLEEHLGRLAGDGDPLLALNLASFAGGTVIRVPEGVRLAGPIRLEARPEAPAGTVASGRTLLWIGAGAEATVLEDADLGSGFASTVTEAVLGDGATLLHARFETAAKGTSLFSRSAYEVGRDASLTHAHVLLPAGRVKAEAAPVLSRPGARSAGLVLALAGGRARSDFRVVADHAAGDTGSRVDYRAIALGRGRSAFTGLLRIREGAARSEAYEEARSLLLSRTAAADVLPELEILNHDVRCTHGAAVAPVDEEALFYLRTRGLSRDQAESMLVEGFVEPVASRLPSGELADRARERLRSELAAARTGQGGAPGEA